MKKGTTQSSITTSCDNAVDSLNFHFPRFEPRRFWRYQKYVWRIQEKRFPNYLSMINHTLDSYMGGRVLKEFKVHMPCLEGANIERWLEFALAREVEIIDINMRYLLNACSHRQGYYTTLGLSNLITKNGEQSLPGLKCLKQLSLSMVNVDDREVELVLSNFSLLESLSIAHSERLKRVSILGNSAPYKLKHLDISYARNIESVEVRDMINLVSLRCYHLSYKYILHLDNVPELIEFDTSEQEKNTLAQVLPRIPPRIRNQLERLKLWTVSGFITETCTIPELINIEHFELEVPMHWLTFPLFPLVEACPSLEKLEIKFVWTKHFTKFKDGKITNHDPDKGLSPYLKTLKISGYLGCPAELEFALFIINNAVALRELVVEPCDVTRRIRTRATSRAWKHFRSITSRNSINLLVI